NRSEQFSEVISGSHSRPGLMRLTETRSGPRGCNPQQRLSNTARRLLTGTLVAALTGGLGLLQAAESPIKPLYPGITPACSCESLTNVSLPNTRIDSAVIDTSNRMCRVTAIVTHPPAGD